MRWRVARAEKASREAERRLQGVHKRLEPLVVTTSEDQELSRREEHDDDGLIRTGFIWTPGAGPHH